MQEDVAKVVKRVRAIEAGEEDYAQRPQQASSNASDATESGGRRRLRTVSSKHRIYSGSHATELDARAHALLMGHLEHEYEFFRMLEDANSLWEWDPGHVYGDGGEKGE